MLIHVKPIVNIRYQCHKTTTDDGYLAFTLTFVSDQDNQIACWGSVLCTCHVFTKRVSKPWKVLFIGKTQII